MDHHGTARIPSCLTVATAYAFLFLLLQLFCLPFLSPPCNVYAGSALHQKARIIKSFGTSIEEIQPSNESHIKDIQPSSKEIPMEAQPEDAITRKLLGVAVHRQDMASSLHQAQSAALMKKTKAWSSRALPSAPSATTSRTSFSDTIYHVDYHRVTTHTPANN